MSDKYEQLIEQTIIETGKAVTSLAKSSEQQVNLLEKMDNNQIVHNTKTHNQHEAIINIVKNKNNPGNSNLIYKFIIPLISLLLGAILMLAGVKMASGV